MDVSESKEVDPSPLFLDDCRDCGFCDGLRDMPSACSTSEKAEQLRPPVRPLSLFHTLSFLDRWLAPMILTAMIVGVVSGVYAEHGIRSAFNGNQWQGVSIPVLVGLLLMMWPVLTKVQYEALPALVSSRSIWLHLGISFVINWIIAPFIMLALAWATLPEASLERERKGVVLVGVSRCIAMVLIWTSVAGGDINYCAILVGINSLLQIILFSPYALVLVNILASSPRSTTPQLHLSYPEVSRSVAIYLGIPLAAGLITRIITKRFLSPLAFQRFIKHFSPLALLGLLYTVVVIFALQGKNIVHNIGSVFRIFVPLIMYFALVWFITFAALYYLRTKGATRLGGYRLIVVQAFTAASNNFELAIAVAIANFGADSPEALAATIGPLVEVPVLLTLAYFALWMQPRLKWQGGIELV